MVFSAHNPVTINVPTDVEYIGIGEVIMPEDQRQITIEWLFETADRELYRLKYSAGMLDQHRKELEGFRDYCTQNALAFYDAGTGAEYFIQRYGINITEGSAVRINLAQKKTRATIRFLDDIYMFGYAKRYRNYEYMIPSEFAALLDGYLRYCIKNNGAAGTIRVKKTKLLQFLCFLDKKHVNPSDVTASVISEYMSTLFQYRRSTIHIISSVLREFFRYLYAEGILQADFSGDVPRPKVYVEEDVPETWTPNEIRQLLAEINRSNATGKRDYAMVLLASVLGMRAGDICALQFKNIDWHRKLITYTQQKTGKDNTLPLLPSIGEAIIDYLKNGRLESACSNVFIRHIPPYGPIESESTLSECIKRYMRKAGIPIKKRKLAHAMRHTLASSLLQEGVPLMTITNIMGHDTPKTTMGYMKVNLPALRKCALSYGAGRESE